MMNNRIEWIDMTKGLGMFLVIAGHTFALGYSAPIYSFHMPLFFFLSGVVFNEQKYDTFGKLVSAKSRQLLKPYVTFYLVSLAVSLMIPVWRHQLSMKQMLIELYTTNSTNINNSSIWYCVCLFFMFVLLHPLLRALKDKTALTKSIVIVLGGVGLLWLKDLLNIISPKYIPLIDNRLPFKIDSAAVALVFFYIGYEYKGIVYQIANRTTKAKLASAVVLFLIGYFINRWSNINSMDFGRIRLLYYPIAFVGIYCCVSFCVLVSRQSGVVVDKVKQVLTYYGLNSLLIFGFQSLLIRLYILFFNTQLAISMELYGMNPIIHQVGSFLVVTFILSPIVVYMFRLLKNKGISLI